MPAKGLGCQGLHGASLPTTGEERPITTRLDLRVYAVLDPARCRGRPLPALAAAAAEGGATLLQLRDKASPTRALVAAAREVRAALAGTGVPLIVDDRVDVALAAGAEGVHLGREDMTPEDARALLGQGAIIGATVHHAHEAEALTRAAVDYAGLGPVFASASKGNVDPPLGPTGLARLVAVVRRLLPGLPCCGIAGIDHRNAAEVIAAGVDGVAVISDIFMADDVVAATRRLRAAIDAALARRDAA
jgi:thiamine-phosphate pyrophosphorylase